MEGMRYTLIKGSFHVVGLSPDGDTIRFQPDETSFVDQLGPEGQRPAWKNDRTRINIRFEAIDALETHFDGKRQNAEFGNAATEAMLRHMGFEEVTFGGRGGTGVTAAEPLSVRGHILAKNLDSFGRVIAFVFAGERDAVDGEPFFVDAAVADESVNVRLLKDGLVYPAFYSSLPVDLKDPLASLTKRVRADRLGLWPASTAHVSEAAAVPDIPTLEELVIWPKLFRRLVRFLKTGAPLSGFDAWLREDPRDRNDLVMLPSGELGNMHDVVQVDSDRLRMLFEPEDLVILPDTIVDTTDPGVDVRPEPQPDQPVSAPVDGLRIVAALVNPAGQDRGNETVTLLNVTPQPIDLAGFEIRDRRRHDDDAEGQRLDGRLDSGDCLRVTLGNRVQLGNSGDDILLIDPSGQVADSVTYDRDAARDQGRTLLFDRTSASV